MSALCPGLKAHVNLIIRKMWSSPAGDRGALDCLRQTVLRRDDKIIVSFATITVKLDAYLTRYLLPSKYKLGGVWICVFGRQSFFRLDGGTDVHIHASSITFWGRRGKGAIEADPYLLSLIESGANVVYERMPPYEDVIEDECEDLYFKTLVSQSESW